MLSWRGMKRATDRQEATMATETGVELREGRDKAEWRPVDSWAHASAEVRGFIEAHDLTVSGETGPAFTGGNVKDGAGRVVARVSYNGKVWGPEPYPKAALLYSPYEERP
jgi:hypothetical protein